MAAQVGIPKNIAAVSIPETGSVRLFGKWECVHFC